MTRNLTEFIFFKDTPMRTFDKNILFRNTRERDKFFIESNFFTKLTYDLPFNWVRDKSTVQVPIEKLGMTGYHLFNGVNYCTFLSDFEKTRYYAYVIDFEYNNNHVVTVHLIIDPIMTFCQGNILNQQKNLQISRQHLTREEYKKELPYLKNNDDILNTRVKTYFHEEKLNYKVFDVLIKTAVDLSEDFGTVDNPKMTTSKGGVIDKIDSPLNVYKVSLKDFSTFMGQLAKFPWIAQNIKTVQMIPNSFIDNYAANRVTFAGGNFNNLFKLESKEGSSHRFIESDLQKYNKSYNELLSIFDLNEDEQHLLRSGYCTLEIYNYEAPPLIIDLGGINENGLEFKVKSVIGHNNEVVIHLNNFRSEEKSDSTTLGTFLNESISFNQFAELPVLIDNFNLSLAKTANQRELAESQLITGRIKNIANPESDIQSKFYDVASIASNFTPMGLFGKFSEEYDYYRQQRATQADMQLEAPTITNQTYENSLAIAGDFYGLHFKYSKVKENEFNRVKKYYKAFGFEMENFIGSLSNVHSMTLCNFVQFKGQLQIDLVDTALLKQAELLFENGVQLYHWNENIEQYTDPIYDIDLINNKWK